jgi:hypothetical protein
MRSEEARILANPNHAVSCPLKGVSTNATEPLATKEKDEGEFFRAKFPKGNTRQ